MKWHYMLMLVVICLFGQTKSQEPISSWTVSNAKIKPSILASLISYDSTTDIVWIVGFRDFNVDTHKSTPIPIYKYHLQNNTMQQLQGIYESSHISKTLPIWNLMNPNSVIIGNFMYFTSDGYISKLDVNTLQIDLLFYSDISIDVPCMVSNQKDTLYITTLASPNSFLALNINTMKTQQFTNTNTNGDIIEGTCGISKDYNYVYIFGEPGYINTLDVSNIHNGWTKYQLSNFHQNVACNNFENAMGISSLMFNNYLYSIGGFCDVMYLPPIKQILYFDIGTNKPILENTSYVPSLPIDISNPAAFIGKDNRAYVIGGQTDQALSSQANVVMVMNLVFMYYKVYVTLLI
eukprot:16873_1